MGRKLGAVGQIALLTGLSRWTVLRTLRGETRPRAATLDKLRKAGLDLPSMVQLECPRNVLDFARRLNLSVNDLDRLISVRLKPVGLMTDKELQHIVDAMSSFPKLYTWDSTSSPDVKS